MKTTHMKWLAPILKIILSQNFFKIIAYTNKQDGLAMGGAPHRLFFQKQFFKNQTTPVDITIYTQITEYTYRKINVSIKNIVESY